MKRILSLLSVFMMCCVMWAGSQTIPTLSTESEYHYYAIKNTRTHKYLYWNNNSDFIRQDASRNFDSFFYFTAGDNAATAEGVTSIKIHNLTTNALMANFSSWTDAGANWYVKAASYTKNNVTSTGIAFSTSEQFGTNQCWNSRDSENRIDYYEIDGGSLFEIEEVSERDIIAFANNQLKSVVDNYASIVGTPFSCTQASYDALVNTYNQYKDITTINSESLIAMKAAKSNFLSSTPVDVELTDGAFVLLGNKLHTNDYVFANGDQVGRGTTKDSYKYEWTLKKQPNGNFKLYNAYTDKYVGSIPTTGGWNSNGDDVLITMVDADAAQEYTIAAGKQLGYVTFKTTQSGINANRSYLHMGGSGIVRWTSDADASNFKLITNVSSEEAAWDAALSSKANMAKNAVGTAIGYYKSTITGYADAFSNATENATKAKAYKQLETALTTERITPDANKYYTIHNATNTNIYLCEKYDEAGYFENTNAVYAQSLAANNVPSLWQFEPCTISGKTDLYYIKAANSGKYFSSVYWQTNNNRYLSLVDKSNSECGAYDIFNKDHVNKDNAVTFVYYKDDARSDRGTVRIENDHTEGKLHSWNESVTGNNFIINEVTEIPVTISSAGVATLNLPFAVTISEGVKAYTGTKNNNEITLSEITGTIPANTPVIIEGEGKVHQFAIAYGNTETNDATGLKGTLSPVTIADNATAYVLKNGGQGIGLYKIDSTSDRTIGANKAYATSDANDVSAPQMLSFNFGNVTGITAIQGQKGENNTYYDLNGRRVLYPVHGIFVKGNGQKVYIR